MNICALSAAKGMIFTMTINTITSSAVSTLLRDAAALSASKSSGSASTATLSQDEKGYDADGDGVLSAIEKAAMIEAQAIEKTRKASEGARNTSDLNNQQRITIDIRV
jgi:hypothetical protein